MAQLYDRVRGKLEREPIEDLRIDFEDGYGHRSDSEEDADALSAAGTLAAAGHATPFCGIRFKSLEAATRRRGDRTLDLFLGALLGHGEPAGRVRRDPAQGQLGRAGRGDGGLCERLEQAHGIEPGRLRFELQIETPQAVLGADGTAPWPR
jgi:hypothetical protein